ncbi:MAG TPA: YbaN family protein, partial [Terrimesophilobacter sp.]|nr:YbaN family protein [Terrimesophilobacter sp.]
YAAIGIGASGLALLGVWLPGLPTTPFIIVALWAFARSSPRLTAWLRSVPLLRGAVAAADRFEKERSLPLWVKLVAQGCAWASVVLVWFTTGIPWLTVLVALGALWCSWFMLRTPTRGRLPVTAESRAEPYADTM